MKTAFSLLTFLSVRDFPEGVIPRRVFWLAFASGIVAWSIMFALLIAELQGIMEAPFFCPMSCIEESAYTYTSSRNYLSYGYLHSGLLQDFSNSAEPSDHPFVYNHMPAGPDLACAFLLQITGSNYCATRIVLALAAFVGLWFFLRFVQIILGRVQLYGAGFTLLFINPWHVLQFYDRLIYNLAPFLIFAPYVFFHVFQQTGQRRYLAATVGIAFISSLYIEYSMLTAVIVSWIVIYLTSMIGLERRHFALIFGAFIAGIFLHLVQNFLYFGPALFLEEFRLTLSNRMVGMPTQQELNEFYRANGVVHHGSHPINPATLRHVMIDNLLTPKMERLFWVGSAGVVLAYFLVMARFVMGKKRGLVAGDFWPFGYFCRVVLWIVVTVLSPIALFPAFAQEVNLRGSGINLFFLAVGEFMAIGHAIRQIILRHPIAARVGRKSPALLLLPSAEVEGVFRDALQFSAKKYASLAWLAVYLVVWCFCIHGAYRFGTELLDIRNREMLAAIGTLSGNPFASLTDLEMFGGELYVTNINTPTVGFFTKSAGFGVCGPDTVNDAGEVDVTKCKVGFMRNQQYYENKVPRYFFFFWTKELFPGFAEAMPDDTLPAMERGGNCQVRQLQDRLDENYERIFENNLFYVYDLHRKKSESTARSDY